MINSLSSESLRAVDDCEGYREDWYDPDTGELLEELIRAQLLEDVEYLLSEDNLEDWAVFDLDGVNWAFTGASSWGDDPTNSYGPLRRLTMSDMFEPKYWKD